MITIRDHFNSNQHFHDCVTRLAKIDLVTIFDCDYRWYCTIDYVIVIFSIIFNDFLAINHLLYIKDDEITCGEPGAVLASLLGMRVVPGPIPRFGTFFSFDMQQ